VYWRAMAWHGTGTHLRPTGEGHRLGRQVTLNSANLIHEIIFDKLSLHSSFSFFGWSMR